MSWPFLSDENITTLYVIVSCQCYWFFYFIVFNCVITWHANVNVHGRLICWFFIKQVYDFADEDQKEDVATEAVEWFPSRIRDPTVHIIIIESDGLVQCREAWKKAAAPLDGLESNILCHALEQIRLQELSHRFLRYTRISVVRYISW